MADRWTYAWQADGQTDAWLIGDLLMGILSFHFYHLTSSIIL